MIFQQIIPSKLTAVKTVEFRAPVIFENHYYIHGMKSGFKIQQFLPFTLQSIAYYKELYVSRWPRDIITEMIPLLYFSALFSPHQIHICGYMSCMASAEKTFVQSFSKQDC